MMEDIYNKNKSEGERMYSLAKKLFPLNRSIMGPDYRSSLEFFIKINPEFKIIKFKTGDKVFDWEVPQEWWINDAYIEHESGKRFAEFKKNNLHLVGYSCAVNKTISKEDLLSHLHTLPENPEAIPYVTSYYQKNWGFCLSHKTLIDLPEGKYKVFIDSKHRSGELWLIEACIPGNSKDEIFFTSYLCHPSMANNELSGPVLLNEILNYVKNIKNRNFTYRFLLGPETIGAIAYLSKSYKFLKKNMICGFNLTCVGDERSFSHVTSRYGQNLADIALRASLIGKKNVKEYSYIERGSDERQYCAPGIDLPLCTFCRSKFGTFPEYHTSLDNFNLVTEQGLYESFLVMKNIIKSFEVGIYPELKILCEPNLGKRGLYPTLSKKTHERHSGKLMIDILSYCEKNKSIFEIAKIINLRLDILLDQIIILKENNILDLHHKIY